MYIDDIKMWARFCPKLIDFQSCNLGVCPEPTASPNKIDSKYNTMDCHTLRKIVNSKMQNSPQFNNLKKTKLIHTP